MGSVSLCPSRLALALAVALLAGAVWSSAAQALGCRNQAFVLKSKANGLYILAELGGAPPYDGNYFGLLRARGRAIGAWERFRMQCLGNGEFAIIAANNRYVSAELGFQPSDWGYAALRARHNGLTAGPWEVFEVIWQ